MHSVATPSRRLVSSNHVEFQFGASSILTYSNRSTPAISACDLVFLQGPAVACTIIRSLEPTPLRTLRDHIGLGQGATRRKSFDIDWPKRPLLPFDTILLHLGQFMPAAYVRTVTRMPRHSLYQAA